jgi:LPS sulfotransferase NodH
VFIPQHPKSIHETEISKVLAFPDAAQLGPDAAADVDLSLFVCFTNRSGSNFLTDLLMATGQLPDGTECFNHPVVIRAARQHHLKSFADYCRYHAGRRARKRRFVAKVSAGQLLTLARLGYLGTVFPNPHFIHIQRYDVVAQAISFTLAKSTRAFASYHAPLIAESDVVFDAGSLTTLIDNINQANAVLREFLLLNRLDHMPVLYEHLVADHEVILERIFAWLGLDAPVLDRARLRYERQASTVKDEWYARYVAEQNSSPLPAAPRPTWFGRR